MDKRVQVALTQSITSLGKEGDLVDVAPGYARNFLLPFGKAAFESGDSSKNNAWVAALTFGEGWHNNHHAFHNSAKQGLFRGQIDITWEHIKILAKFGLAKKVKLPSRSYY